MNHMTTLVTKQAEFIVKASLAFLQGELAVSSELVCQVHFLVSIGFRLVFVFVL